jgi:hypothetical protein
MEIPINPFIKLNKQYISGTWRDGASSKVLTDRNPVFTWARLERLERPTFHVVVRYFISVYAN